VYAGGCKGQVEVFPDYLEALKDVDGFSHLILLYHFHMTDGSRLTYRPFLDGQERGMFAIRHFNRPNPIGISVVRLEGVRGNILDIADVDILDGTPLLDIKPYVPRFDHRSGVRAGWYENASERDKYDNGTGYKE
ncbi:MAG: tRNA (N6-threonylcarbamoyladenosine(37)-N6)-methyltransferase TrmO, partial [Chloroflexota bacterium]|nr:tRNA (N6-threonylcarbamoyladenosine(37)-N6)-methyltransferase TrmO [Chloroflexota bacterium]